MSWSSLINLGNVLLASAVAVGFFINKWWIRLFVFTITGFFLKFYPGMDFAILFFLLSAAAGSWLGDFLRKKTGLAAVFAVVFAEIIFNLSLHLL